MTIMIIGAIGCQPYWRENPISSCDEYIYIYIYVCAYVYVHIYAATGKLIHETLSELFIGRSRGESRR